MTALKSPGKCCVFDKLTPTYHSSLPSPLLAGVHWDENYVLTDARGRTASAGMRFHQHSTGNHQAEHSPAALMTAAPQLAPLHQCTKDKTLATRSPCLLHTPGVITAV